MFNTGLEKYLISDVNAFTSDAGIKLRRKILRICTARKPHFKN